MKCSGHWLPTLRITTLTRSFRQLCQLCRASFPRRLWFLLKLLLFHPTGRQREHHSPLLGAAKLLSKGEEMPSLAAIVFRSHETPHGLGKDLEEGHRAS